VSDCVLGLQDRTWRNTRRRVEVLRKMPGLGSDVGWRRRGVPRTMTRNTSPSALRPFDLQKCQGTSDGGTAGAGTPLVVPCYLDCHAMNWRDAECPVQRVILASGSHPSRSNLLTTKNPCWQRYVGSQEAEGAAWAEWNHFEGGIRFLKGW
jgi:hypothetical protein